MERIVGLRFDVAGLDLPLGSSVDVLDGPTPLTAEVISCGAREVTCMPYGDLRGLRVGARVASSGHAPTVPVGHQLLGRVINALGQPLDDGPPLDRLASVAIDGSPPHPLRRARIDTSPVSYTPLRAPATVLDLVCRLRLEKNN